MNNEELIKKVKAIIEKDIINENSVTKLFSNDVITAAYQRMSASVKDIIENEEDPVVLSEVLKSFLEITAMIDNKDNQKQQILLKAFEQLNKYEQSRYY